MIASGKQQSISLRVSVTDRCQLRCRYCLPAEGVSLCDHPDILHHEEVADLVRLLQARFGLSKVHLTGGEPLVRKGILDLVALLAQQGVPDLALTTNGDLLVDMAGALKQAGLHRVNVSLDSLRSSTYRRLTRGGTLQRVLAGIDAAQAAGLTPLKLNMTVLRGINHDEILALARFGLQRGIPVRFLELMPIGPAKGRYDDWFVSTREVLGELAAAFRLEPLPLRAGASSVEYRATNDRGEEGTLGVISSCTQPFCGSCRRLRLTAVGQLVGCLATGAGQNIRSLLRTSPRPDDEIIQAVREALSHKRNGTPFTTTALMSRIGG